jgi:TPR repeat protein
MCEQESNLSEAKKWYLLAADAGHPSAMHNLGVMAYQIGNRAEAKKWYLQGAEAGDTDAMINLGVMAHDAGDQAEAKKWFKLARPNINSFEVGD